MSAFKRFESESAEETHWTERTAGIRRQTSAPHLNISFADYLYDMLLFLTLALWGSFTWGGLVWTFFLRVALCSLGTTICLSAPLDMKPGPFCRWLGTADDMVVVSLLLICVINIGQQIACNGENAADEQHQASLWFGDGFVYDRFVTLLLTAAEAGLSNTGHGWVTRCARAQVDAFTLCTWQTPSCCIFL